MAKLTIKDAKNPNLNDEYELDLAGGFTKAEYFIMKKHVGVIVEDLKPGAPVDMNVLTAWGLVVLHRAEKDHLFAAFMDTTDDQTIWDFDDSEVAEDDADPPAVAASGGSETNSGNGSSGANTKDDSENSPETPLRLTGVQT